MKLHIGGRSGRSGRQDDRLRDGLLWVQRRFRTGVGEVRAKGLVRAIEWVVDETVGDRTPAPDLIRAWPDTTRALLMGRGRTYINVAAAGVDEALTLLEQAMAAVVQPAVSRGRACFGGRTSGLTTPPPAPVSRPLLC